MSIPQNHLKQKKYYYCLKLFSIHTNIYEKISSETFLDNNNNKKKIRLAK